MRERYNRFPTVSHLFIVFFYRCHIENQKNTYLMRLGIAVAEILTWKNSGKIEANGKPIGNRKECWTSDIWQMVQCTYLTNLDKQMLILSIGLTELQMDMKASFRVVWKVWV